MVRVELANTYNTRNTQAKYASRALFALFVGIGELWCMVVLGGLSIVIMRVEYACIRTGV